MSVNAALRPAVILAMGLATMAPVALAPHTATAQEPPARQGERCVCVVGLPDREGEQRECSCADWSGLFDEERMKEAMVRMHQALERTRGELDEERMREAMARMEEALERARADFDPEGMRARMVDLEEVLERARAGIDPERMRAGMAHMEEALDRARAHMQELRLDTIRIMRSMAPQPRIGLEFSPAPAEGVPGGVRLTGVTRGSAAADQGLRAGDVIVEMNGHDLSRPLPGERLEGDDSPPAQRLSRIASELTEGDTVRVVYLRDGERRTAALEVRMLSPLGRVVIRGAQGMGPGVRGDTILVWPWGGEHPRFEVRFPEPLRPGTDALGLRLMDLNPELGAYFGRDEGVLILEVEDGSPLALRSGDVLLRVDGRVVEDSRHARSILRSYRSGERIRAQVLRQGREVDVEGRVP
jgi:soluble cytochrome b562